jgi:hypothetical protein
VVNKREVTESAMTTTFSLLFGGNDFMTAAGECFEEQFKQCDIVLADGLQELSSESSEHETNHFFELNFLEGLRAKDDEAEFLPNAIYIRNCMKRIFRLTAVDIRKPRMGRRALIGSPGVGKSVLFFLVALHKACHTPVLYYRKTGNYNDRSLFFMNATENGKVHIVFTRTLPEETDSKQILKFLKEQNIDVSSYYRFVDGPKYDENDDTFNRNFDYFCTSGGYPLPKQEELDNDRLWILDAWTEDEAIAALTDSRMSALKPSPMNEVSTVTPLSNEDVNRAYWLCGGSIRNMLKACESSFNFAKVESYLENIVDSLGIEAIECAVTSTVRRANSPDSIRSMFRNTNGSDDIMRAIQIVDSRFILGKLSESLSIGRLHRAMRLAKSMEDKAVQGIYFEHCCHRCFKELIVTPGNHFWLKSVVKKDIKELEKLIDNIYWLPINRNFPDIDAAFVRNGTLYALQYTVGQKHSFDLERFWDNFASFVINKRPNAFSSVCVTFVVPLRMSTTFRHPQIPSEKIIIDSSGTGSVARTTSQKKVFLINTIIWQIETNSVEEMKVSLYNLLSDPQEIAES